MTSTFSVQGCELKEDYKAMEKFNSFLLGISKKIRKADLDSMKFICKDYNLGERRLGEITEAYQLFDELQREIYFQRRIWKYWLNYWKKLIAMI